MSVLLNVEIAGKDWPDARFKGRLLGQIDSKKGQQRERWTLLQLWELESGRWVATAVGRSEAGREKDIGTWQLIEAAPAVEMQRQALGFWSYSWLAKDFADKMGWSHVHELW